MIRLTDLYRHQAWADAEHWRAIAVVPAARADGAIHERLHHIHFVQHAFLWIAKRGGPEFRFTKPEEFPAFEDLVAYARKYYDEMLPLVDRLADADLSAAIDVPWFKDPPVPITLQDALLQAAMHSHYHRAQNATRLRELGGEPPLTDYIAWVWQGRPAPEFQAYERR